MPSNRLRTDFTRVFLVENGAGPAAVPTYEGTWKVGAVAWSQGNSTLIRVPDPAQYGNFITVDEIPGDVGIPEMRLQSQYLDELSDLLRIIRNGCTHDIQVHMGTCKDPRNFDAGWDKILVLSGARGTNYGLNDLGALDPKERALILEEVPFGGQDLFEIGHITFTKRAVSIVLRVLKDVTICDSVACGSCGVTSDGCQVILAVQDTSEGSPGLAAEVIYSSDGGSTWGNRTVASFAASDVPTAIFCTGSNVIVLNGTTSGLAYATLSDLLLGQETWAEQTGGFNGSGAPQYAFSNDPSHTWIVGAGGYVYFTNDPTSGVSVQDAGNATSQQLNCVHGIDNNNIVAVGNSNAVVYTTDGGTVWASVTGPAVGVNLNACWMVDANTWWVGTAAGRLWYTRNKGATWHERAFPGSGSGTVTAIKFSNPTVGYMAHATTTPAGRILRTVNGGATWYVAPEGTAKIDTNRQVSRLAVCPDLNSVVGAGIGATATAGFLVQGG